ncbi:apolipoprotein N-acyltransferase [Cereibacter sphaeroides]|uniref:apolipoprotein N-acyltransferase n=1 Tax=Cereibacter sphaeroides TaxID=1063 RepID=UPI001F395457|nr:apolipoprotein N-acyltransferase [Cereibacter sphaeroides]MCE6968766.1 apolipoprotein N-acyltransferase [Cereibacter sphaeroides]
MTVLSLPASLGTRLGLAFAAGLVMATGQAPLGLWWLALPALVALTGLVASAATARRAALLALLGGAGHFALALSWIVEPFLIDVERYGWMAPFALVLMAFGLALFWGAAGWLSGRLAPGHRAIGFATTLAAAELARGYLLTGFPWAMIGHVWVGAWPAQVASLVGPSGLTLMTTLAAALPVALRWRGLALSAALVGAMAGFGLWRLGQPEPEPPGLTLRLVQPNAAQSMKWDPALAASHFGRLLSFTAAGPRPDLAIWPETSVPYMLDRSPGLLEEVAASGRGAPVVIGIQRGEGWRFWNSLAVVAPDARLVATYDKHHLAPFGEYVPLGDLMFDLFGLRAFAAQEGYGYSAGDGPKVLDLGPRLGRVLPLICYEAVFPQDLRTDTRADWILQITNDAWFGTFNGPYQHLAQTRLRAIEQGLPLVRVANTGVSALIDARGRVLAELPLGQAGYKDVALPAPLPATPFSKLGEMPVLFVLAGLCGFLFRPRGMRRA